MESRVMTITIAQHSLTTTMGA